MHKKPLDDGALAKLTVWLADRLPGDGEAVLAPLAQTAGNSHAIYLVTRADRTWVLRVAPDNAESKVGNAYNLQREWVVLNALRDTAVPHAAPVLRHDESAPIDRDFLLVEWIDGITLEGAVPQQYSDESNSLALTDSIVDTLVDIGGVDWQGVGLGDFGRPEGYLERQFDKGRAMLDSFRTRDTARLTSLLEALEAQRPAEYTVGLIHGDYSPLNLMVHPAGPAAVKAVLDWETSTIGDVMIDIGYLTARWVRPEENPMLAAFALGGPDPRDHAHLPARAHLVERFAAKSGRSMELLPYYQGFAMLRVAIALEGRVASLSRRGEPSAAMFAALVDGAAEHGWKLLNA